MPTWIIVSISFFLGYLVGAIFTFVEFRRRFFAELKKKGG